MGTISEDLMYTKDHEWVRVEENRAIVGITDHAQSELGDIVFVELPATGTKVSFAEEITEIESTKTTAPVLAPVSGMISEVNDKLKDSPELMNDDPYGRGWIAVIQMDDPADLDKLMGPGQYETYLTQETGT